jgi:hypothetical protein
VDAFLGAFGESTTCNGRYFTQTGFLPPLPAQFSTVVVSNNKPTNSTDDSFPLLKRKQNNKSKIIIGKSIPVTYTNNPRVVDDWLCRNLPYDGSIIGFDIEVSIM